MCVGGCAVVPVGTSQWFSPPLACSQHPSESNMWIRLREESIDMCFMEMPSELYNFVSLEPRPALFSAAQTLYATENGAGLGTRLQFHNFTPSINYSV